MLWRTCPTKEETPWQVLLFRSFTYIYTYIYFFLWYHPSIVSVSRPRLDLHPGELLQAWSRLTPGRPQDRDPHHRREIPGWRDTSCRKPEELRSGAVCYRWGRTHAGALVSSRVKKTFRCAITASPLRRRLSPQAFRFEFVRLSHSRDCDVSGTPRGLSAYTGSRLRPCQRSKVIVATHISLKHKNNYDKCSHRDVFDRIYRINHT